jgi:putative endonuclease
MKEAWIYILECADGKYYTGSTTDLQKRLYEHQTKKYNGYTSYRLPVKLVFSQMFNSYHEAYQFERKIKNWSHAKKEALIKGDFSQLHKLSECKNESHFKNK